MTEGSHFSLVKTWNETSLTVRRALSCHVGSYDAYASFVDDDKNVFTDNATFELVVHGKKIITFLRFFSSVSELSIKLHMSCM